MAENDLRQWYSGFTLLELLVSIFIFAIVVTSVYGAYRATFHIVGGTEKQVALADRARVILERISADLESFHTGETAYLQGTRAEISGHRADSLSFVSSAHLVFNRTEQHAGLTGIKYITEEDDSGFINLYRADVPVLPGETGETGDGDQDTGLLLGQGLQEFRITYIDASGDENEEWDSGPLTDRTQGPGNEEEISLPLMIRVEVRFSDAPDSEESTLFRTAVSIPAPPVEDTEG